MIVAFTGAGISKDSGVPTFEDIALTETKGQLGIRDKLERGYAQRHPEDYQRTLEAMQGMMCGKEPNAAHRALAELGVPVLTMNIDGLHEKAGSKHVVNMHGSFPNIVLYGDPAPNYQIALDWVEGLNEKDLFLIIGTSFYTTISEQLRIIARAHRAKVIVVNENASTEVPRLLNLYKDYTEDFDQWIERLKDN